MDKFRHLTYNDRLVIKSMIDAGKGQAEIGQELGFSQSTISDELRRGKKDGKYNPEYANELSEKLKRIKGKPSGCAEHPDLAQMIADYILMDRLTPAAIAEIIRRKMKDGSIPYANAPSTKTSIYAAIARGEIPGVTSDTVHPYVKVFNNGTICLPNKVVRKLDIQDGDYLYYTVLEDGTVSLSKVK